MTKYVWWSASDEILKITIIRVYASTEDAEEESVDIYYEYYNKRLT